MARSGLLILTQPLSHLRALIPQVVEQASSIVNETLYVCLQPALQNLPVTEESLLQPVACTNEVQSFIKDFYMSSSKVCHTLDIRVLLSHICPNVSTYSSVPYRLKKEMSFVLSDSAFLKDVWDVKKLSLLHMLKTLFVNVHQDTKFSFISVDSDNKFSAILEAPAERLKTYPNIVLGGTFDYIHAGHKLLLSESCLICDKKLTVGITDGDRNKKKLLWELMEPYVTREDHVISFVTDVKPSIIMEPVKIFDAFGPTITDPNLDCIVVSDETKGGGKMVNEERFKLGFNQLDLVIVDLVDDVCHVDDEELKISSSNVRKRLLGTLMRPLSNRSSVPLTPYRVAVTGSIASGKSNVCNELEKLGAKIVNCDLLGHRAYLRGTPAYHAIVKEFGETAVLDDKGEIDRRKLGSIVFSDKSRLDTLNSIVWPSIRHLVEEEIDIHRKSGTDIVVIEAAVLFEAGWNDMVHEIWTTFATREKAIERLMSRNGLSQSEAEKRVDSQISDMEKINKSNVLICSRWQHDVTRKQIEKAWSLMQQRISSNIQNKL